MIKSIFTISVVVCMITGCSSEDKGLCKCVEATNRVNELSATFLDGSYSEGRKDSLFKARRLSDSLCVSYQKMAPEDLHKAAENCSSLKMNPPQ